MSGRLRSHPAGRSKGLAALELALLLPVLVAMRASRVPLR